MLLAHPDLSVPPSAYLERALVQVRAEEGRTKSCLWKGIESQHLCRQCLLKERAWGEKSFEASRDRFEGWCCVGQ